MDGFSADGVAGVEIGDMFEDVGKELYIGVYGEAVDGGAEIGCAALFYH